MTNSPSERIASLTSFQDSVGELLLDIDPEHPFYWELVAQAQAAEATVKLLRPEVPTLDMRMDPCSPYFDPTSWTED